MFCANCGSQVAEGQNFCPKCGAKVDVNDGSKPANPNGSQPANPNGQYGYTQQNTYHQNPYQQNVPTQQYMPMNWFNFLIYFALWAGAIWNIVVGIMVLTGRWNILVGNMVLTGRQYVRNGRDLADLADLTDLAYCVYPNLQTIDILYGIAVIAAGLFFVYACYQLARFKANGPKCLYAAYIASAAIRALYFLAFTLEMNADVLAKQTGGVTGAIIMLAINVAYFGKRKHMFVN